MALMTLGPHLGLNLDLVTLIPIWASPGPVDRGPQLGKIGTR